MRVFWDYDNEVLIEEVLADHEAQEAQYEAEHLQPADRAPHTRYWLHQVPDGGRECAHPVIERWQQDEETR